MSQRKSSRRRNLPSRLQDCDLSGGVTVESGEENGQQGVEDLNWVDEVENEDVVEVDEPPGLLLREEEEDEDDEEVFADAVDGVVEDRGQSHEAAGAAVVEGPGGQRGGGGADAAFDGRPLPSLSVVEDQSRSNEAAGAAVDEGPGGQRGGGGADAAFDGRPLPSQSQGTQDVPSTQLPDVSSLPSLEEAHTTYIPTHKWPPKAVRPELSRALTSLWQKMASNPNDETLWIMECIFFRCLLPAGLGVVSGDQWSQVRLIRERLRRWQAGECGQLWREAVDGQKEKILKGKRKNCDVQQEELSLEEKNARRCRTKAQEGQYSRAVQSLVSCGLAEYSPATLAEMQQKHPAPRRPQPPPPSSVMPSQSFSSPEVSAAALSFPKGSGAGPSGMRPEHLISVLKNTSAALATKALAALTRVVNVMAAGKVPARVRPFFCGARLVAGRKKDDSLRPIAIGNLLRRVVAKCFSSALAQKAATLLAPNQLGVGVRGGAEAIAHAVTEAVKVHPSLWVLQVDLVNAFNSVDRGVVPGPQGGRKAFS